jgi:ABC-2 type transport system ATP-binding protein
VDVELRQSLWAFVRELNTAGHTIVLTTHYLEEAQALCTRIAMLKKGRLIALENKDTLLAHSSAREIMLKLSAPLPESLRPWLRSIEEDAITLLLPEIAVLEQVLARLREARIDIRELAVIETDLESVFVKMMNGTA